MHPEAAAQALERLIPDLVQQLQRRHLGARRLSLIGFRVDGSTAVASVATAIPSREPKHIQRLLVERAHHQRVPRRQHDLARRFVHAQHRGERFGVRHLLDEDGDVHGYTTVTSLGTMPSKCLR